MPTSSNDHPSLAAFELKELRRLAESRRTSSFKSFRQREARSAEPGLPTRLPKDPEAMPARAVGS